MKILEVRKSLNNQQIWVKPFNDLTANITIRLPANNEKPLILPAGTLFFFVAYSREAASDVYINFVTGFIPPPVDTQATSSAESNPGQLMVKDSTILNTIYLYATVETTITFSCYSG